MNHSLPLFIAIDRETAPLISGISDVRGAPAPVFFSGSPRKLSICFVTPPTTRGGTGTVETTTRTITLTAKRRRTDTANLFADCTLTATGSGDSTRYEGVLDTSVAAGTFADADQFGILFELELKDTGTTPIERLIYQFGGTLIRKGDGDATADPLATWINEADADARYLSYIAAQSLTSPQQAQAWANLSGTTFSLGLIQADTAAATATVLGLGTTSAVTHRDLLAGTTDHGIHLRSRPLTGIITQDIAAAQDSYTFEVDSPTDLEIGMYVFCSDYPNGTTVTDVTSTGPTTTITLDQPKAYSGTASAYFSADPDAGPRLRLFHFATEVATINYRGDAYFAGTLTADGAVSLRSGAFSVAADGTSFASDLTTGLLRSTHLRATESYGFAFYDSNGDQIGALDQDGVWYVTSVDCTDISTNSASIGTLYLGGYTLALGGNISFTATGRLIATAASNAAAFDAIKQDATPAYKGVVQLASRSDVFAAVSATLAITPLELSFLMMSTCRRKMPTGSNWTAIPGGTGAGATQHIDGAQLRGPTSGTGGYGLIDSVNNHHIFAGRSRGRHRYEIDFGKLVWISFSMMTDSWNANAVWRVTLGKPASGTGSGIGALGRLGLGARRSGTGVVDIIHYTSGSQTVTPSTFTPTYGQRHDYDLISLGNGTIYLYANGSLVATATGGPTTVLSDPSGGIGTQPEIEQVTSFVSPQSIAFFTSGYVFVSP